MPGALLTLFWSLLSLFTAQMQETPGPSLVSRVKLKSSAGIISHKILRKSIESQRQEAQSLLEESMVA
jgi:hypothetical protein